MMHRDDVMAVGNPVQLASTEVSLRDKCEIKTEMLVSDATDVKEVRILNKVASMTKAGVELGADPRHSELVAEQRVIKPSRV